MLEKQKARSNLLALINATVSHELRNPLNSINAINLQNESLYDKLDHIFNKKIT